MKKLLTVLTILLPLAAFAQTQEATLYREGDQMKVSAIIKLDPGMVKGVKAFVLQPRISDGENSVDLKPIGMYSKQKFYPYLEPYGFNGAPGEIVYRKDQLPTTVRFTSSVPYERWMDGSQLELVHLYEGCCGDGGEEAVDTLATYEEAPIQYAAVYRPVARELTLKTAELVGYAAIDFPVGSSKLSENYHNNAGELEKISQSIQNLYGNQDVTMQSIVIRAQSSPEGKFETNEKLANARAQAVADYVTSHYELPEGILKTQAIPENWTGTRDYVNDSEEIKNKAKILEIIDNQDLDPDVKEQRIKRFSKDWTLLTKDCFPYLRRTVYQIVYQDIDVESTNTHLDRANKAMADGNTGLAAEHLAKAGDSAEAEFARGTFFASKGDYKEAAIHYQNAADGGIESAQALADEVGRVNYMRIDKK